MTVCDSCARLTNLINRNKDLSATRVQDLYFGTTYKSPVISRLHTETRSKARPSLKVIHKQGYDGSLSEIGCRRRVNGKPSSTLVSLLEKTPSPRYLLSTQKPPLTLTWRNEESEVSMSFDTSEERWYALQIRQNYELTVVKTLRDLGVEEYLPVHKVSRLSPRSKFTDGFPLFPGYVFTYLNLNAGPRLYSIPGFMRILGYGGHPTPIEDHEIAMVRAIAASPLPVEPCPFLQPGERILLTAGPLKGVSGTFVRSAKGDKLVVSLHLLKRSLAVTVVADWVAALDSPDSNVVEIVST